MLMELSEKAKKFAKLIALACTQLHVNLFLSPIFLSNKLYGSHKDKDTERFFLDLG